jgi:hypothetical protein
MTYDETMHDFIVRTHAGQKLVFSLCDGLYICDMTSQVYRNLRARCDHGVELFVGNYKSTDNWKLQARLDNIHLHARTLVDAAAAYPEMGQRDDYQEAIEWLRADGAKLEKAIEYRRRELFDQTGSGVTNEENPVVAKLNPHGEHMRGLTEIGIKRYQLEEKGFFSSTEESDEWQNTKMAESARRHSTRRGIGTPSEIQSSSDIAQIQRGSGSTGKHNAKVECAIKRSTFCRERQSSRGSGFNSN